MSIFGIPSAIDLSSAAPSTPFGTTRTVDVLGLASATDGSAGNVVSRTYYCTQNGVSGTITDAFTYGLGSTINGNPVEVDRGAFAAFATGFTTSLGASSEAQGTPVTVTFTPVGGAWPAGVVLTPAANTIQGAFSPATLNPSGFAAATCVFTPSNAASGSISATANPAMTNIGGGQADTSTPVVGTTISGAALAADGKTLTLTLSQACSMTNAGAFALTVAGSPAALTWNSTQTGSSAPFILTATLASQVIKGAAASYSTTAASFASPALASLASGAAVTNNSTQSQAGTILNFTGASGAPTGNQVLTAFLGTSVAGFTLDGAGNLQLSGTAWQFGLFQALGQVGDGTLTATMGSGGGKDFALFWRTNPGGPTGYQLLVRPSQGSVLLYKLVNSSGGTQVGGTLALSTLATALSVAIAGSSFTVKADGATLGTFADTQFTGTGYLGIGSTDNTSPRVLVSQISLV